MGGYGLRPRPQGRYDAGMKGFLIRCAITGLAVLLASQIIPGMAITSLASGVAAVVILAFLNAIIRPILYLLSAPFILVTFGLFMIFINGFLLYLVSILVKGFIVSGFWPAVGGALIISFVSAILNFWISEQGRIDIVTHPSSGRKIRHIN
jgi:putative membrane protein